MGCGKAREEEGRCRKRTDHWEEEGPVASWCRGWGGYDPCAATPREEGVAACRRNPGEEEGALRCFGGILWEEE